MFLIGSDDGVYRLDGLDSGATKTLASGRAMRLRRFGYPAGVFAATETGLYRSPDGRRWTDLGVPDERVYAVGADADGCLYAGTRPARIYVTDDADVAGGSDEPAPEWRELDGFRDLPSRAAWRLPRHDDLAQVRDVRRDPGGPDRLVAGVEVGGVHVSDDGGETWRERTDGVDDDVHELHVVGPGAYVAATGHGLYATDDAGRTWTRLDEGVRQRYFRRAFSIDGVVYAAGALSNSSTWEDDDAEPALFALRNGDLEPLAIPAPDETVTGMAAVDGALAVATHRGHLFVRDGDGWREAGTFPVPGPLTGRYTPVTSLDGDPTPCE